MQRFLAVGRARLHVLEAGAHDPREAHRIVATLDALRPRRIWLDLSGPERVAILQGRARNPLEERVAAVAAGSGTAATEAVARAAHQWAQAKGVPVHLLLPDQPRPRRLDLWRLDRMLRREGFEAPDPTAAIRRLHLHYISRVPGLVAWLDRRWSEAAKTLAAGEAEAGAGGIVLCSTPDAAAIADRVQRATSG